MFNMKRLPREVSFFAFISTLVGKGAIGNADYK